MQTGEVGLEYYKLKKKEERLKKRCKRHPDDKCKDGGQVATFDGANEKETGDVVEDEDEAGEPTEAVAEGTIINEYTVLEQVGHDSSSFV